jgi:hypothetical protein
VQALAHARCSQGLVLEERSVLDHLVDAEQVLLHHRAGTQVQMADLRVPHLALG